MSRGLSFASVVVMGAIGRAGVWASSRLVLYWKAFFGGVRSTTSASITDERRLFTKGNCKVVLPVSLLAAQKHRKEYPAGNYLVEVVHPGVDERFFAADVRSRLAIRTEFGISENDFLILFVGMNFELKGLEQLLVIMARLRDENLHRPPKLLVVGKGNREKYEKVAGYHGLHDDVLFAGIRHDMPAVYAAADLFVLLSGFDTFGMVVIEAMASGLPVIVSDTVGASDLVRQGVEHGANRHGDR